MAAKRLSKAQIYSELAETTELPKKKVAEFFDALTDLMKKQLTGRGPGEFVFPGLLKVRVVKRGPTKDRPGRNPQTGEPMIIKGKPASKRVKATPLKGLKEMVL
jgi:nucleoid DNA-binding protein